MSGEFRQALSPSAFLARTPTRNGSSPFTQCWFSYPLRTSQVMVSVVLVWSHAPRPVLLSDALVYVTSYPVAPADAFHDTYRLVPL